MSDFLKSSFAKASYPPASSLLKLFDSLIVYLNCYPSPTTPPQPVCPAASPPATTDTVLPPSPLSLTDRQVINAHAAPGPSALQSPGSHLASGQDGLSKLEASDVACLTHLLSQPLAPPGPIYSSGTDCRGTGGGWKRGQR